MQRIVAPGEFRTEVAALERHAVWLA